MGKFTFGYALVMVALAVGVPTQGAIADPADAAKPHCVVEIFPVDQESAPDASPVCFATEEEVAAFLAGSHGPGSRAAAASIAVGTVYKDAGGTGGSLTFWGSSACSGVTFGFPTVPSGWDNSISSMRAATGCWGSLHAAANYGGSKLNCTPYGSSIGSLNDSVGSLVFRPTGQVG